jgi:hypothetical protein
METILFFGIVVALGIFLCQRARTAKRRQLAEAFPGRDPQMEQQFYERYFISECIISFAAVANILRILEAPVGRRPLETDYRRLLFEESEPVLAP